MKKIVINYELFEIPKPLYDRLFKASLREEAHKFNAVVWEIRNKYTPTQIDDVFRF